MKNVDTAMPQNDGAMIEYEAGEMGGITPKYSYNMENFTSGPGGKSPIRTVGRYELPRWQYLPWQPWLRVPGMPTEMPNELKIPPNIPRDSKEFRDWLAARSEWERYLAGPAEGGPAPVVSREEQIARWEVEQELKREAELARQSERAERDRIIRENIRRKMKGMPSLEEEEKKAKEEQDRKAMWNRFSEIQNRMSGIRQRLSPYTANMRAGTVTRTTQNLADRIIEEVKSQNF